MLRLRNIVIEDGRFKYACPGDEDPIRGLIEGPRELNSAEAEQLSDALLKLLFHDPPSRRCEEEL